jgi:Bacterial EndoU nuclease
MTRYRTPGPLGFQIQNGVDSGTLIRTASTAPFDFMREMKQGYGWLNDRANSALNGASQYKDSLFALASAIDQAHSMIPRAVQQEVGVRIEELIQGVLPTLLLALAGVAATTALGATIGGIVGFFLGGAGAGPGAVLGGKIGMEAGIALLTWLGLGFLVVSIGKDLVKSLHLAEEGIRTAWGAGTVNDVERKLLTRAAAMCLSRAVAVLMVAIVDGLIAYITRGAATSTAAASATRVSEAVKQLKSSRLGRSLGTWFEKNYRALMEHQQKRAAAATANEQARAQAAKAKTASPAPSPKKPSNPAPGTPAAIVPLSRTVVSAEMEKKILYGQRVMNPDGTPTNRLVGAHGGKISNANPNYAVEVLSTNADGTRNAKLITQYSDGKLSKIKSSTLFPETWTDAQAIGAIVKTGDGTAIATRASDGAALYQSTINGVKVEVIKVGNNVTAGYPAGKGFSNPTVFKGP